MNGLIPKFRKHVHITRLTTLKESIKYFKVRRDCCCCMTIMELLNNTTLNENVTKSMQLLLQKKQEQLTKQNIYIYTLFCLFRFYSDIIKF